MTAPKNLFVGQLNTPDRVALRAAFKGVFERRFYTNHGPLVAAFEDRVAERLGVAHVICVANGTVALMIAAKAAGLSGEVIVPAYTFPATVQALVYAGLEPALCDVDPSTHAVTAETVAAALSPKTAAIVGVHMWGRPCDVEGLSSLAEDRGLHLMFDAAHAFDISIGGRKVGGFGLCEVFSFHATKVLNCGEGGCIATNDSAFAAACRTAANFHDRAGDVETPLRINGKMSEAQAAMGLVGLETLDSVIEGNRARYAQYRDRLEAAPGVRFIDHAAGLRSNCQYVVLEVDPECAVDQMALIEAMRVNGIAARRYFYPGMHRAPPCDARHWNLPITDRLCRSVMQTPSGETTSRADIDRVCDVIEATIDNGTR